MPIEQHPLEPFLPKNAKVLVLGSFPPPKSRWSMDFFYPNFQNDFWRIVGSVMFNDRNYFVNVAGKCFDKDKIVSFCSRFGMAMYDTAEAVTRLKNNASDNFLQIEKAVDLTAILKQIPDCHVIVATGEKAAATLSQIIGCGKIEIGRLLVTEYCDRRLAIWRMPSTSRAYPLPFEQKALIYSELFKSL